MMPLADFDEPSAVRDRFALLCGKGAIPGGYSGLPAIALEQTEHQAGKLKRATLQVPVSAPFFTDHFPRRPVLPGTLLMGLNSQLAISLAGEIPRPAGGGAWKLRNISNIKFRAFTPPGTILYCEARLDGVTGNAASVTMETRDGKKVVATGKALFSADESS
jgi:3-hydroxyacyl-[acyl-carrier-protein] dehydratase